MLALLVPFADDIPTLFYMGLTAIAVVKTKKFWGRKW